jgi:hypothetical protein
MANASIITQTTVQTTYDDMLKKKEFGKMLGLDENGPWDIVSENEDLAMIHHQQDADMNVYGTVRGVVLDKKTGNVVSYSYPHAQKFVLPTLANIDGVVMLDKKTAIPFSSLKIKIGFEGPLIQIFKHNGKVYHATRKRLDSGKSRWGNSKIFEEIWKELEGPSDDTMFNVNKKYSPYCHTFIMNHPDVLICTKDNVGRGNLIYLGPKQMYSTEPGKCPYPLEEVDTDLHVPNTVSLYEPGNENKSIHSPDHITLEEANKHLLFGFYEGFEGYQFLDSRLLPGEFLILEDTNSKMMYRVESPSYAWRSAMRNNNPNFLHRFFELLDLAYLRNTAEDEKKYMDMVPILTTYDVDSLRSNLSGNPMIVWPQNTEVVELIPTNKDAKLYNIWQCFLVSVPLCRQLMVVEFFEHLLKRRDEVTNWIVDLSSKMDKIDILKFSPRVQDILMKTRSFAAEKVRRGENVDRRTKVVRTVEELTVENIRNFISKEKGSSLYRIIREMDRSLQVTE